MAARRSAAERRQNVEPVDLLDRPSPEMNALRERVSNLEALVSERDAQLRLAEAGILRFGALRIERFERRVIVDGRFVELLPREYELLLALALATGATVSRRDLERFIWREPQTSKTNAIAVHVSRLRSKLAGGSIVIETGRGAGYSLVDLGVLPASPAP